MRLKRSTGIKVFMLRRGLSVRDIAKALKVTDQAVSKFVLGQMKSDKIQQFLEMHGCPKSYLYGSAVNA